jgi:hypothetical protein
MCGSWTDRPGWDGMGWDGMGWNGMGEKRLLGDSTPLGWGSDKKTTAVSGGKDRGCKLIRRMPWVDSCCQTRKRM